MNSPVRALLGAAVGAILVLVAHPATRPAIFAVFRPLPQGRLVGLLERPHLPSPTDLDTAAAYLHAGAERIEAKRPLAPNELKTLLVLARRGETAEPDNPFWPIAQFALEGGEGRLALQAWGRASRCKRYNDHQRRAVIADVGRIAERVGDTQAWMYAAVASRRSDALLQRVRKDALQVVRLLRSTDARVEFAYETIRNGAMIRDGSETLDLGRIGIAMIEAAPYPPDAIPAGKSPIARLYIAKTGLTAELRKRGRAADAAYCDRQFRINDSWAAFASVERPDRRFQALALAAILAATLPGALIATSILGSVIWIFGTRIGKLAEQSHRYNGSGLAATSLTLLIVAAFFGSLPVGLAAGACALVPAFSPNRPKRYAGDSLGPLHVLVVATMAFLLIGATVLATVARSLPGTLLPDLGRYGALLGDADRWGALAVVVLGASALVAPAWAYVRRYPTTGIAARTYRQLGRGIVVPAVLLAVFASPLSLAADRWLGDSLSRIAQNEQNAYNPRGLGGE